jgi:hypothetical protein
MPILVPAQAETPLRQGDVLFGTTAYGTDAEGEPVAHDKNAGVEALLVMSRPCNALRDQTVVVAPVRKRPLQELPANATFQDLVRFFQHVRDGDGALDQFYLGEFEPGSPDRYFAKFDLLFTIGVPGEEVARLEFLRAHRKYSLNDDFVRDLQIRVFRAFSSLGFDDYGWWSDGDLGALVARGDAEIAQLEAEIQGLQSRIQTGNMAGTNAREMKRTREELETKERALSKAREALRKYREEYERRGLAGPSHPGR